MTQAKSDPKLPAESQESDDDLIPVTIRIRRGAQKTLHLIADIEDTTHVELVRNLLDEGIEKRLDPAYIEARVEEFRQQQTKQANELQALLVNLYPNNK